MNKERLDILLVSTGLVESRSLAQRLVMAGQVRVNGEMVLKPSTRILNDAKLAIKERPKFVSRGGEKLEAALLAFHLTELRDWVCADVGASTGGFTDCLLQHGAAKVYAIDVGHGLLDWKLRQDVRVSVMEKSNARFISALPELIDLATIDASFISLKVILPAVNHWMQKTQSHIVALIKPQFEAGRAEAARGDGVIRDQSIHEKILKDILSFSEQYGFVRGLIRSPLKGPKGNTEFLMYLGSNQAHSFDWQKTIEDLLKTTPNEIEYTSTVDEH